MEYRYPYPHPALTVDCAVFGLDEGRLKVLLVERGEEPYKGAWALPGGFVRLDESLEAAALRELEEETGVRELYLEQLGAFGEPGRDPRERVVTVAYFAIVNLFDHPARGGSDASAAAWFEADAPPRLAFDHADILAAALDRLRGKLRREPLAFEFLPRAFTLTQLQRFYETVLGAPLDKRNFRKKILSLDLVIETDEKQTGVRHRAARLYRFDRKKYDRLVKHGFEFAI